MGTWDRLPWDNDAAADWFAELNMSRTRSSWKWRTLTMKFEQRRVFYFS